MASTLEVSSQSADLWLLSLEDAQHHALLDEYLRLLSRQERQQHERFRFAADRHRYLATRALVRCVLSRYVELPPEAWQFASTTYGRPVIANDVAAAQDLCFNLSHSADMVLFGVTRRRAIGVDIENTRRNVQLAISDRFFSSQESADLRRLPSSMRSHRFFELWTLKESYVKARGMGLHLALDTFGFRLGPNSISMYVDGDSTASTSRWRFWQFFAAEDQLAAVCLEDDADHACLKARQIVPLLSEREIGLLMTRTSIGSQLSAGKRISDVW
jgi:4'-phosphopantetheinyl transferase